MLDSARSGEVLVSPSALNPGPVPCQRQPQVRIPRLREADALRLTWLPDGNGKHRK